MTVLPLFFTLACALKELPTDTGEDTGSNAAGLTDDTDADADGYSEADGDCDDLDAAIHPGAEEVCDEADNNCDGQIDEGVTTTFYADADGDAYGDPDTTSEACSMPVGYTDLDGDCDDLDALTNPVAAERCDDVDNDCDGQTDEDLTALWYYDGDGDGYGDAASAYETCNPPPGWVPDDSDCDDDEPTAHPGGSEVCDEADNDCDGDIDENVTTTFYLDSDGDGYGSEDDTIEACSVSAGYSAIAGDCDDDKGGISPHSTELCDGVDNDCDGQTDELNAADASDWYADADGDGYGSASSVKQGCSAPSGYVGDDSDCDDTDSAISPGAAEVCDSVDNNCNSWIDANDPSLTDGTTYYADADGDGYGTANYTTVECSAPTGYVDPSEQSDTDCDDTDADTWPGADELCDEVDNDCDGTVDEDAIDPRTFYRDFDSDRFGDASTSTEACSAPTGYVEDGTDCNDTQSAINPGATESCNDKDDDCDGDIDDDDDDVTGTSTWHQDYDRDGYGSADVTTEACDRPSGYVTDSTDCDDTDSSLKPGAVEVCDEVDNDCDGDIDDDDASVTGQRSWYVDADGDGFGDAAYETIACDQPSGLIPSSSDCDDTDRTIKPGAEEVCDGVDNNCDDAIDEELLGETADCPAHSCKEILDATPESDDGVFWLTPSGDVDDAFEGYCDMTGSGGGWTRVFASLYPTWWGESWGMAGEAEDDDYSILDLREHFMDDDGAFTLRLQVGSVDTWNTGDYDYMTIWTQGHDPIEGASDGSDSVFVDGDEPTTCDGFSGLHSSYYDDGGSYAMVSDPDTDDDPTCWGMQLLPLEQYGDEADYPGYLDGYSGGSMHTWQVLWMR